MKADKCHIDDQNFFFENVFTHSYNFPKNAKNRRVDPMPGEKCDAVETGSINIRPTGVVPGTMLGTFGDGSGSPGPDPSDRPFSVGAKS